MDAEVVCVAHCARQFQLADGQEECNGLRKIQVYSIKSAVEVKNEVIMFPGQWSNDWRMVIPVDSANLAFYNSGMQI